ncbi:MAG: hypothetical protein FWG67_05245 [Defluviitaleaceae bacterium]|nr:hypothetical protein [Defluviitaleaceae bacterium]
MDVHKFKKYGYVSSTILLGALLTILIFAIFDIRISFGPNAISHDARYEDVVANLTSLQEQGY